MTDEAIREHVATDDDGEVTVEEVAETQPVAEVEAAPTAEQQRDEYLADLQRLKAEFDNFRRRTMREGAAQRDAGAAVILRSLLDVVDDFELAVLATETTDDVERLRRGVELVYGKLVDVLRAAGVERVADSGVPFDPTLHDAVHSEDGEADTPVVTEVLRAGYRMGDRVLRPAMVKVTR